MENEDKIRVLESKVQKLEDELKQLQQWKQSHEAITHR